MISESWFEECDPEDLMQGDILLSFPVLHWRPDDIGEDGDIGSDLLDTHVIVLTQSCDLENNKTDFVLLAEIQAYEDLFAADAVKYNKAFRKDCSRGKYINLVLLPPCHVVPTLGWSVVNFSRLHSMPTPMVVGTAAEMTDKARLRSPYREHVSQAFGRYFMRVALPTGLSEFEEFTPKPPPALSK